MTRRAGWFGLGFAGLAVGTSACGASHAPEPRSRDPIAVTLASVAAVEAPERVEAGGIVAAHETALIGSRLLATIATVRVRAGDRVAAGDVLVTLDARDVAAQARQAGAAAVAAERALAQARTGQSAADAEHRLAGAWQKRIAGLHARRAATDQERDEAESRFAATAARATGAGAGIEMAEAHLDAARAASASGAATASFSTLRAPFAGVVAERLADPGTLAAPGTPLLRLEAAGPREVQARVDAARAGRIGPGDRVQVIVDATAPAGGDGETVEGVVTEVARAVAADPRAFTVTVSLPATTGARTGSFARVLFDGPRRRALVVPATAVRRHGQVTSVFVVQDRVARLRLVHLGGSGTAGVEVLAGLDAGEAVVASPPAQLVDGAPVVTAHAPRTAVTP